MMLSEMITEKCLECNYPRHNTGGISFACEQEQPNQTLLYQIFI